MESKPDKEQQPKITIKDQPHQVKQLTAEQVKNLREFKEKLLSENEIIRK